MLASNSYLGFAFNLQIGAVAVWASWGLSSPPWTCFLWILSFLIDGGHGLGLLEIPSPPESDVSKGSCWGAPNVI